MKRTTRGLVGWAMAVVCCAVLVGGIACSQQHESGKMACCDMCKADCDHKQCAAGCTASCCKGADKKMSCCDMCPADCDHKHCAAGCTAGCCKK